MNRQQLTVLLILCLLLAGIGGWWLAQTDEPDELGQANQLSAANSQSDSIDVKRPDISEPGNSSDSTDVHKPEPGDRDVNPDTGPDPANTNSPIDVTPIPDGHWRLTGRVVSDFKVKHSAFSESDLTDWYLTLELLRTNDGETSSEWFDDFEIHADGRFSTDIPEDELETLAGFWRFDIYIEEEGHPLEGYGGGAEFDYWANDDGKIDMSKVRNLLKPTITGRQANFGDIRIGLNSLSVDGEQFVCGRIVHTSGAPLANTHELSLCMEFQENDDELRGPIIRFNDYDEIAWVDTDENGWFFGYVEDTDSIEDSATRNHHLLLDEDYEFEDEDILNSMYSVKIAAPKRTGAVWDYGVITVDGCLITVEVEGGNGDLDLDEIYIEFTSGHLYHEKYLPVSGGSFILQPARYRWSCYLEGDDSLFEDQFGTLDVKAATTTLVLKPVEIPCVRINVIVDEKDDGNNSPPYWIQYSVKDGINRYHGLTGNRSILVPALKSGSEVTVGGRGYVTRKFKVNRGDDAIDVLLKSVDHIAVTVVLPTLPADLTGTSFEVNVRVLRKIKDHWSLVGDAGFDQVLGPKPVSVPVSLLDAGRYRFDLTGGANWGYGQLGSEEIEVKADVENAVVFEAIAAPRWKFRAGSHRIRVYVDDQLVDVTARTRTPDGAESTVTIDSNENSSLYRWLAKIIDGNDLIQPAETAPTRNGDVALTRIDLPHRLTVSCRKRGKEVGNFKAECGMIDSPERCSLRSYDGAAKLWLPPGKAWVSVEYNNKTKRREINIPGGRPLDVQFDFVGCDVTFTGETDNPDDNWPIHRVSKRGSHYRIDGTAPGETLFLTPGKYFVYAPDARKRQEFEISADDETMEIELPTRSTAGKRGEVHLNLELPFKSVDNETEFSIHWTAVTGDSEIDSSLDREYDEVTILETPEGLLLKNVPIGEKICLFGGVECWNEEDDDRQWHLKPIVLNLTQTGTTIDGVLTAVAWEGDSWDDCEWRFLTTDGLPIEMWYGLPVGRHEFGFYHKGNLILREWITVPAMTVDSNGDVSAFDLPVSTRTRLEQVINSE
ncbi:MAG: RING finger protein [Planctomycetota bacterium]|jgi:hypothetical protein